MGNFGQTEIPPEFLFFLPFFFQRTGQLQCQVEEAREAQLQAQEEAARLAEVRMCPHTTADATYEVACVTCATSKFQIWDLGLGPKSGIWDSGIWDLNFFTYMRRSGSSACALRCTISSTPD